MSSPSVFLRWWGGWECKAGEDRLSLSQGSFNHVGLVLVCIEQCHQGDPSRPVLSPTPPWRTSRTPLEEGEVISDC